MKAPSSSLRALIRADGGGKFGMGHIMRGLAVAEALRERGWRVDFLMADLHPHPAEKVRSRGFGAPVVRPAELEGGWAPHGEVDLLWVEHHEIGAPWLAQARTWSRRVAVIDDLADRPLDCDLVVCPAPRRGAREHYRKTVPSARLLLGPEYAPLDRRFRTRRPEEPRWGPLRRIVVSFGGADWKNQTCKVLEALGRLSGPFDVTVIAGALNPHREEVEAAAARSPHRVEVKMDVDDMAALLAEHDLVVGAAGDSAFERCCLGLPAVVIVCAENQEYVAQWLKAAGAAEVLGAWREVEAADVAGAVSGLLRDDGRLARLAQAAWSLVEGRGAERVADALTHLAAEPLLPASPKKVKRDSQCG